MRKLLVSAAGVIVVLALAAYLLLVADWFAPRSQLHATLALTRSFSIKTADLHALSAAAKQKYGPQAEATLKSATGMIDITLDGKLVETVLIKGETHDIIGIIAAGPAVPSASHFPFHIIFDGAAHNDDRSIGRFIRARLANGAPPWLLAFDDTDWNIAWCRQPPAPTVGADYVDATLRLQTSDICLVEWRGPEPATMLVGGVAAEGGAWVRHVARRVCRSFAASWLATLPTGIRSPDYAACFLAHAPGDIGAKTRDMLTSHFYEVRADRTLAVMQ